MRVGANGTEAPLPNFSNCKSGKPLDFGASDGENIRATDLKRAGPIPEMLTCLLGCRYRACCF